MKRCSDKISALEAKLEPQKPTPAKTENERSPKPLSVRRMSQFFPCSSEIARKLIFSKNRWISILV